MRYADDTFTNERMKQENGEREVVTNQQLQYFVGDEQPDAEAWELLLDILNGQVPVADVVQQIKDALAYYELAGRKERQENGQKD